MSFVKKTLAFSCGAASIDPGEAPKSEGPYSERSALQKTPAGKLFSHIMNSLIASPQ